MSGNMNWRTPGLSDLDTLQNCAVYNDFFANNYSAVNSILYEKKFHSKICIRDGWIFEKLFTGGKRGESSHFSFPHNIKGNPDGVKNAVKLLEEEARTAGEKFCFVNITGEEKDVLFKMYPSAKITFTPESGDYIYKTEKLALLSGRKLSRKRNHIHQFEKKYPDISFENLNKENLSFVRRIEEEWLKENLQSARADGTLLDLETEKEIIFYALDNFEIFSDVCGMSGGILFVSGKPAAFCISSLLSKSITDVHFEKCLSEFGSDGGYSVINNLFSKTVRTEFVNREEDLGIEGLRKAKLSYYPEQIIEKYSVEIINV